MRHGPGRDAHPTRHYGGSEAGGILANCLSPIDFLDNDPMIEGNLTRAADRPERALRASRQRDLSATA